MIFILNRRIDVIRTVYKYITKIHNIVNNYAVIG